MTRKKRIAVLGGGMAALSAVFELTRQPGWQDEFDISVYQMGFRLGGKGASGRNLDQGARIEEHGLHILFGFYENAFRLLRECYAELARPADAPLATWREAFQPHHTVVFPEEVEGRFLPWTWRFLPNEDVPGDGLITPTPWWFVTCMLQRAIAAMPASMTFDTAAKTTAREHFSRLSGRPVAALLAGLARQAAALPPQPRRDAPDDVRRLARLSRRLRAIRAVVQQVLELRDLGSPPTPVRRACILFDFLATMILGMIDDGLVFAPVDWFRIDGESFKGWLQRHGARPRTAESALVRGMYAGIFSSEGQVGAGTMLHYTLRMLFTYKGAILYKMQAGMGDAIFAPLYEVLRRRGVKFHFFHRVDRLSLASSELPSSLGDGGRIERGRIERGRIERGRIERGRIERGRIERIVMGRQVRLRTASYEPLVDVDGLPCWPSEPLYEQIEDGEELRQSGCNLEDFWTRWRDREEPLVLEAGRDFDTVILGISVAALPHICRELMEDAGNPAFRRMVLGLATTQTQAAQLWFSRDLASLGWPSEPPIVIPHALPFDTWADMSHLIPREHWPAGALGSIAYLCGPLDDEEPMPGPEDHEYPARQDGRVARNLDTWLSRHAKALWPHVSPGQILARFHCAPKNPSDRYVLSVPGSVHCRLGADESGYENLILAGDWTRTPISAGCLEATVMSGMRAAASLGRGRAILGDWEHLVDGRERMQPVKGRIPARAPALPAYIAMDLGDTPAPPHRQSGATMHLFALKAETERLRALCDRHLNIGSTRYRPLGPLVWFYCLDIEEVAARGGSVILPERDFGFLVPLVASEVRGGGMVDRRVVNFLPYLWVDSEQAARGGREVYGFPKLVARLTPPKGPYGVEGLAVDIPQAIAGEHGGRLQWTEARLIDMRRISAGTEAPGAGAWMSYQGAVRALTRSLRLTLSGQRGAGLGWSAMRAMAADMARGVVPMVFLKQVRDVEDSSRACYQAIVEASARMDGAPRGGGWIPGRYELRLHGADGALVADRLGLAGNAGDGMLRVQVLTGAWLRFDFVMEPGRVIYQAGAQELGSAYSTPYLGDYVAG